MIYFDETIDCGAGPRRFRGYIPDRFERAYYTDRRPAVVIVPGGCYSFTFPGEAEPIALAFAGRGIPAFILDYTVAPLKSPAWPWPQLEAFAAIRFVRERAEEYGIDPENIASVGFSAGGHLCASTGTLWNKACMAEYLGDKVRESRPDKLILCYPVIRGMEPCHKDSFRNLFGPEGATDEICTEFSLQDQVDGETPPAFIWATAEDTTVPIQGALQFALALADHGVHQELHIYPHGAHGACLGDYVTEQTPVRAPMECAEWIGEAVRFLLDEGLKEKIVL